VFVEFSYYIQSFTTMDMPIVERSRWEIKPEEGPRASISTSLPILSVSFFHLLRRVVDCYWPRRPLAVDFWFQASDQYLYLPFSIRRVGDLNLRSITFSIQIWVLHVSFSDQRLRKAIVGMRSLSTFRLIQLRSSCGLWSFAIDITLSSFLNLENWIIELVNAQHSTPLFL